LKQPVVAPCFICEQYNSADAQLCKTCSAPTAIATDSAAMGRKPSIVSIVGESNVGKTVYLGFLLDMLSQRAGDFEAIPKGAFSIDIQQTVIGHMARRSFPPKTPMEVNQWYWAYYQVRRRMQGAKWADLVMPDMAGESLSAEVATPQTFGVIRNLLAKSEGALLLIDAAMAAHGSQNPDFFAMKILSYIDALRATKPEHKITMPTAIVLCKADHCPECFDHPRRFVEANLNRLWNLCKSRFENVEFFASSVIGSLGYATLAGHDGVVPVPLHTALRGVLEPFEWILDQI